MQVVQGLYIIEGVVFVQISIFLKKEEVGFVKWFENGGIQFGSVQAVLIDGVGYFIVDLVIRFIKLVLYILYVGFQLDYQVIV